MQKLGAAPVYDAETFEQLALQLFDENGRLSKDDPDWNCPAKFCKALAKAYQAKYPKVGRIPKQSWLKKFSRSFLLRYPELDLVNPRQRKP